jgi:hypothetical protein
LVDPSLTGPQQYLQCRICRPNAKDLPDIQNVGDIVRIHRLEVWLLFTGDMLIQIISYRSTSMMEFYKAPSLLGFLSWCLMGRSMDRWPPGPLQKALPSLNRIMIWWDIVTDLKGLYHSQQQENGRCTIAKYNILNQVS